MNTHLAQQLPSTRPLNAVALGEAPGGTAGAAVLPKTDCVHWAEVS